MSAPKLLKKDSFGEIFLYDGDSGLIVERHTARASGWLRWLARRLLRREARVLAVLDGIAGVPRVLSVGRDRLQREYIAGRPMQVARPKDPAFFAAAQRL